ncbi:MAG: AAA family ATPase [Alphaproteobacteria bacterium]|nr:AAA family ATPase [Alphaproteobacteria bacterium]
MTKAHKEKIKGLKRQVFTKHYEEYSYSDVFQGVLNDMKLNNPVMLVGPAGCGKSTLLYKVSQKLELPYYPMSVNSHTTVYDIVGYKNANGDYVGTAFRDAYEKGGIFSFEEIDAGNPNVLTVIHQALDTSDFYLFPDGSVKKHKDFRLCASANTYGNGPTRQYVGRNPLDAATLDRFAVVDVDYDEDLERQIGPVIEWTVFIQALRHVVSVRSQELPPIIISTRAVVLGGRDVQSGTDWDAALRKFVWRGISLKPEVINAIKREAFELFINNYFRYERTK